MWGITIVPGHAASAAKPNYCLGTTVAAPQPKNVRVHHHCRTADASMKKPKKLPYRVKITRPQVFFMKKGLSRS